MSKKLKRIYGIILAVLFIPMIVGPIKYFNKEYSMHLFKGYFWDGFLSVLLIELILVTVIATILLIIWLIFD